MSRSSKSTVSRPEKGQKTTPLMGQYQQIKSRHPDALLLFRVGDFYETFGADAIQAAAVLGITLTKRANGAASTVELAGFPYHSLDTYLPKLVRAGLRVAICEQLEDPKQTKTLVRRGVTEMITPGLVTGDKVLDHRRNNFLAAFAPPESPSTQKNTGHWGLALLDLSTGQFEVAEGHAADLERLMEIYRPAEVLLPKSGMKAFQQRHSGQFYVYPLEDWIFQTEFGKGKLLDHFRLSSLKGFGLHEEQSAVAAAGAILHYLGETAHSGLAHISAIRRLATAEHMLLDRFTLRNLEIVESLHPDGRSLLDVLDQTITPMGARMLRQWLSRPLLDVPRIQKRLNTVEYLLREPEVKRQLHSLLQQPGDLERSIGRLAMGKGNPRDLGQIARHLAQLPDWQKTLCKLQDTGERSGKEKELDQSAPLNELLARFALLPELREKLRQALCDELPAVLGKGPVIRDGFDSELDELRLLRSDGRQYLAALQQKESESSGIPSLKIGYNQVFGYYLEVTRKYRDQVPETWIRKQTLVNAERFVTPELKTYEEKILTAESRIAELEQSLFQACCQDVIAEVSSLQKNAAIIGRLDVLHCFASNATEYRYRRPSIQDGGGILMKDSRHPVIERLLPPESPYIPNDVQLNREEEQILLITGPNMSGKSALMRQTALIVLMAQCGSFVPASSAQLGVCDRLFTRVGASDHLSGGESTFMVEMLETASIVNNLSSRSLVILDEIGRGTSTFDGISIAWSLVEYLHQQESNRPLTLFATHYHELNELASQLPRVRNMHIQTKESGDRVLFLRKLTPGDSQHSFGIHVARMAGMPASLLQRAREVLERLESQGIGHALPGQSAAVLREMPGAQPYQLSIFEVGDPALGKVREALQGLDVDRLSPIDSLLKIKELQDLLKA